METLIDEVVEAVGGFVDEEYEKLAVSRSLNRETAASTIDRFVGLGFTSVGAAEEFRQDQLQCDTRILSTVAERWGSLAWGLIPKLIANVIDPDNAQSDRTFGVCFPATALDPQDLMASDRWSGALECVLLPHSDSFLIFPAPSESSGDSAIVLRAAERTATDIALDGLRHAPHGRVELADAQIESVSTDVLAALRIMMSAVAVGMARGALRLGSSYAKERKQFGHEIGVYGEIRAIIGLATRRVSTMEDLVVQAAARWDQRDYGALKAAMLLSTAAENAYLVAERMQHVHGGYGQMKEFEIGAFVRDTRILGAFDRLGPQLDGQIADHLGLPKL